MSYYYWNDEFKTEKGETLIECHRKYGLGKQRITKNYIHYIMDVIFLDERKTFGNSWCIRLYNKKRGTNIPVTLCEPDKIYGQCPLLILI